MNKENMMTDFQELNTTVIQVRSVLNFMYALGYQLDEDCKSGRFITKVKVMQGNRYLSMDSAVRMHNLGGHEWTVYENRLTGEAAVFPEGVDIQRGFTPIGVELAMASKLVDKVKFYTTRHGNVVVRSMMVKPLNHVVASLLQSV